MRYYVVRNRLTSKFAIIEEYVYDEMISIMDENAEVFFELYFDEAPDHQIWDSVIEAHEIQSYDYIVINDRDSDEIHDFVFSAQS